MLLKTPVLDGIRSSRSSDQITSRPSSVVSATEEERARRVNEDNKSARDMYLAAEVAESIRSLSTTTLDSKLSDSCDSSMASSSLTHDDNCSIANLLSFHSANSVRI